MRLLAKALQLLGEDPDLQQLLRDHRDRIPNFIEETLRIDGPIKGDFRLSRVPTTIGGVDIPAGTTLMVVNAAANRDPRRFDDPAEFRGRARQRPPARRVRARRAHVPGRAARPRRSPRQHRAAPRPDRRHPDLGVGARPGRRAPLRVRAHLHPARAAAPAPRVRLDATPVPELPKIISVDDHIVEPAHLWQKRLPARLREQGPRIEQARWGDFALDAGASYKQEMTDDGRRGDYWVYEDRLIYVHKRHVAIPLDATPDGDVSRFDRGKMYIAAMTYDEMRPGCYEPRGARRRPRARRRRRFDRVPHVPALLRPDVPRGQRSRARARVRARLQRLHDRGVVRRLRRSPAPAVPDPALGRRARGRRDQSQRGARRARDLLQRDPDTPRAAEHPHRLLGSAVRGVRGDADRRLHAHRIVVEDAGRVTRLAALDRDRARLQQRDGVARPTSSSPACSCASPR